MAVSVGTGDDSVRDRMIARLKEAWARDTGVIVVTEKVTQEQRLTILKFPLLVKLHNAIKHIRAIIAQHTARLQISHTLPARRKKCLNPPV
jgi:hypothetical protein